MSSKPSATTFKLVLLGDGRVGKTSLVLRYVNNVFSEKQQATVQASYLTKRVVIEGVPITLAIWDTAGQERFHALGPIYYRDADAALLVYDMIDSDSFVRVRKWVTELQQMASKTIIIAIAANKSDLVRSKKFDIQEAESYAASIGARVFVTSAKSGEGIDEVFLDIATRLLQKKKESAERALPTPPRKGILIVDDEPEIEPQPKCCS
ncbi:putative ras-related protein Rab-21 [Iris pallida]|uniref:Ras-related protein Rab-21 n=1 Tax=Iris pallida TaxID=29817 RepID=A0AAX6F6D6_IRIPA|nr:putative ras-related protein Rab-21 [Iris pallida]KAJ6811515.1 putative ras-related protein Rab-21 [Iris pallida]